MEDNSAPEFKLPDGIKDPSIEFELLESLGRGSFGAVYKAMHKKTGHIVAVKQVPVNEDFQEILKEINIMKQCRSKYVIQYYGNYFKGETCWIIMEYAAMGSVSDMMNVTNQTLNEEQIALVCYSTLKGLYYLHKNSKIHRDIKPGNILVTSDGECKLADFGVSGTLSERTRKRNTVIGTPFFLAPEVIQEVGYDSKADIWALGISAIEMAEFNPPYHDLHPMRVLFMIPTAESPKLKESHKWSPEFSDFIRLCLAKEQAQRPTAKDLLRHPFFEKKVKGTYVMKTLTDSAQNIIERAGGREKAIKEAAERKARRSGETLEFTQSESISPMNSDDEEEDLLEKNNKIHVEEQKLKSSSNSSFSPSTPPVNQFNNQRTNNNNLNNNNNNNQKNNNNLEPLNELDSLLNGIIGTTTSNNNNNNNNSNNNSNNNNVSHARSSSSNLEIYNNNMNSYNNNNTGISKSTGNLSSVYNHSQNNQQNNNNNNNSRVINTSNNSSSNNNNGTTYNQASTAESPSPVVSSSNFSRQLSNNSFLSLSPNVPSQTSSKSKAPASELDDLLEEMLNPSFGSKPRGLTPISSPSGLRRQQSIQTPPPMMQAPITRVSGLWSGRTAGGCANTSMWRHNPQYQVYLDSPATNLRITLRQTTDKLYHIGFYFAKANASYPDRKLIQLTRDYLVPGVDITFLRNTEVSCKVVVQDPGYYVIIPATFEPGQEGTFELEISPVEAIHPAIRMTEILSDRDWKVVESKLEWRGQSAGGSFSGSSATWKDNPKFMFEVSTVANISAIIGKESDVGKDIYIGFYVFKVQDRSLPYVYLTASNLITKTNFLNGNEVIHSQAYQPGCYVIIPCTYDCKQEGSFTLSCFSDVPISHYELRDHVTTLFGEWKLGESAGGCLNHSTWRTNPQYLLTNQSHLTNKITIIMDQIAKDSNQLQFAGFYVARSTGARDKKLYQITPKEIIGNTEFINDFQVYYSLQLEPGQSAVVIPCTFNQSVEGEFSIRVISNSSVDVFQLPTWRCKRVSGEWRGQSCGGRYSNTSSSWTLNPRFLFTPRLNNNTISCRYVIILNQSEKQTNHGIGFYYFKTFPDGNLKELICKSGFVSGKEVMFENVSNEPNLSGVILPATFEAGIADTFTITVYCDKDFDLTS